MRILALSLMAFLVISSCNQVSDTYTVNLNLENIEGEWITLTARVNRENIVFDSVLAEADTPAVLSKSLDGVQTMYLAKKGDRKSIKLLMENAEYTISGTFEEPVIETTSGAQQDLNSYNMIT